MNIIEEIEKVVGCRNISNNNNLLTISSNTSDGVENELLTINSSTLENINQTTCGCNTSNNAVAVRANVIQNGNNGSFTGCYRRR